MSMTGRRHYMLVAAEAGDLEYAKRLLKAGCDINEEDYTGNTASIIAVKRNDIEMLKLLIDQGANVNIKDVTGRSMLEFAKKGGVRYKEVVDLLEKTLASYLQIPKLR